MFTLNLKTDKYIVEEGGTWVALTQGDVVEMLFQILVCHLLDAKSLPAKC